MSGTARPWAPICATWLFGSSRSPNRIAPAMHATEHIGVASGSTPGVSPWARPASTRSLQKVHLVITPWRPGGAVARSAGVGTEAAADAGLVHDVHDAVVALLRGPGGADGHARRLGAVHALHRQEEAAHVRVLADLAVGDEAPLRARGQALLLLAGDRPGLAADAPPRIGLGTAHV